MQNIDIRTDLAIEAREMVQERKKEEIPGVKMDVEEKGDIKITRVHIQEEEGQRIMGKPKGNYITLEIPKIREKVRSLRKK